MDTGGGFNIAGIQFATHFDNIFLPGEAGSQPSYRQFFLPDPSCVPTHRIDILITADPGPNIHLFRKIFESQDAWNIYIDGDQYYITNEIPSYPGPLWIARVRPSWAQVTIHCAPPIIEEKGRRLLLNPIYYPLDQILMMHILADIEGVISHAAGWIHDNNAWIFPGRSGAGKTTVSKLIARATGTEPISDDRVIVRKIGDQFRAYGTPWPGEAGHALNQSALLEGIFVLKKGEKNTISILKTCDAISQLLPIISVPWYHGQQVDQIMAFCDSLLKKVPVYQLTFTPDEAAITALERFINER